jgi:hypothetical protein
MQETRCRLCDGIILTITSPEDRPGGASEEVTQLEYDGSNHFLRCPRCSARNIATKRTGADGNTSLEIVRAVMDDQ